MLDEVRDALRSARDAKLRIKYLEQELSDENRKLQNLEREVLPNLFRDAGIDELGVPAEGNMPAYHCRLKPFYRANIAASWPQSKRYQAYEYLKEEGAGDLIKSIISVRLPLNSSKERERVEEVLCTAGITYAIDMSVPWTTLTAWVKESIEREGRMPDLEKIGGTVGEIVVPVEREEK